MSSDDPPEFDDSSPSRPEDAMEDLPLDPGKTWVPDDATEYLPSDPSKTWVPDDRQNFFAETSDFPSPSPEMEAGSLGGLSPSSDDPEAAEENPGDETEPPRQFGEYELLERVGHGGMGNVYKAHHRRLDRIVALKTLKSGTARSESQVERFVREAKAAARLDHPNIVPCYEIGEHRGWHYLTMAFVKGESLDQRLGKGPLEPREAARMIQALAGAVSHAHKQGVIHRDIKPSNVILSEDGRPRLTDFGIAKLIDPTHPPIAPTQLTLVGQALGTPGYMAPEQSSGRRWEIGPSVDIYALGGLMVAALTGHPASGDSLETLPQELPEGLQTISHRCLAFSPLNRYATADDLLKDLDAYLQGDCLASPASAPPKKEVTLTLPEVTIKFPKSHIWIIAGFILAVLICSFLLATWFTGGWRDADSPPPNDREALNRQEPTGVSSESVLPAESPPLSPASEPQQEMP